jgi:hypothetical protein
MRIILLFVLWPLSFAVAGDLGSYWNEGKAELNGYRLKVSRYGQPRDGRAVLIYVAEPFLESKRVKPNDWRANPADTFQALKLNIVRDFQTGLYDYNTMVSVFVRAENMAPVKITFSSAEWCGHVYDELLFQPSSIQSQFFSYFEGETRKAVFELPADGIAEDSLFLLLRGLREDFVRAGKARGFQLLPSLYVSRLSHQPLAWLNAAVTRAPALQSIEVPAGKFETVVYNLSVADGRTGTFHVEYGYPHRIVRWDLPPDISAELTGTIHVPYWQLNKNGDEKYLADLGLKPTVE